ncbi:MAG TPA: hypothetical protein VHF47_11065 [Acidimicrobiales bacterium]|nr:hypothetical protein [Acidimicrobiales bacterium]
MRRTLLGRALGAGLLAWAGWGAVAAPAAHADCVQLDVEVRYYGGTSWYPLGGPDHCVVPTDWEHMVGTSAENNPDDPGSPAPGFWLEVWVPVP